MLSFAHKHWDGQVPTPNELREADRAILTTIEAGFNTIGEHLSAVRLRAGLFEAMRLAGEVNKYLDEAAPWFEIKTDKSAAATTVYTALRAIDSLKVLFSPYLPFTSNRLHKYLGYEDSLFGDQFVETIQDGQGEHDVLRYDDSMASGGWEPSQLPPGQIIQKPAPLFRKLDESIVGEERSRLG
jgi:methionyl-tRNA synthetase